MSQTLQVELANVKEWLSKETSSQVEPLKSKASNMLKQIRERIEDTTDSAQKIMNSSRNEMDKNNPKTHRFARNANKFSESLINTLNALKVSDDVKHDSLQALANELEKTCGNVDQLRRSAYPYISPYFIFDRRRLDVFIKRLFDITKELRGFIDLKYSSIKTIDDVHSTADRLVQVLGEVKRNEEKLRSTEASMQRLEKEIFEVKDKLLQTRSRAELAELVGLDRKIEELRAEIKHSLRYLQKPFYKLQSLSRASEVAVPPDEIHNLDEYLADPLFALASESDGYPTLKSTLQRLDTAIVQGRLKLKSTRLRKAQDQINAVLNMGTLSRLQKSGQEALAQRRRILSSEVVKTLQNESAQLQRQLDAMQKDYELSVSQNKALKTDQARLKEKTENLRKELEETVSQLTRKKVQIALSS